MGRTKVRKAVIPVAGLGTRFLPATKSIPKEMIPIVDTPMIQYIVEEALDAGIDEIFFVTARNKESIENHFDHHFELEERLARRGNMAMAQRLRGLSERCSIVSIRQKEPLGLGHAILCAQQAIGDEPFAILLGDDLMDCAKPCIRQLMDIYEERQASVVAIMQVPESDVSKYGIISGVQIGERLFEISTLIEKPKLPEAPSRMAIPGRYIVTAEIFDSLRSIGPGRGGELQLTDGLVHLLQSQKLYGYEFQGQRFDTGDRLGFLEATLHFALKRPDLAAGVRKLICDFARQCE